MLASSNICIYVRVCVYYIGKHAMLKSMVKAETWERSIFRWIAGMALTLQMRKHAQTMASKQQLQHSKVVSSNYMFSIFPVGRLAG